MPSGIYVRRMTPAQVKSMRDNLAKGREKSARKKAAARLREIASDPAWREFVGKQTSKALWKPVTRKKMLAAVKKRQAKYGSNFKGGNGQEITPIIRKLAKKYEPLGYIREFPVKTKGHKTNHKPPDNYKVDFGHPGLKIAIEVDGPLHRRPKQKIIDKKKQEVLEALGWKVRRIKHD